MASVCCQFAMPLVFADPVTRLQPGTSIQSAKAGSSGLQLVLIATPRLNSGDTESISETISEASTQCSLVLTATTSLNQAGVFQLKDVAVCYSLSNSDSPIAIDSDSASELGVSLGLIGRQVLRSNEENLSKLAVVGRSETAFIFDAPSIMFRRNKHRRYVTRHLVAIDPARGTGELYSWLMVPPKSEGREAGDRTLINCPIRRTKWGTRETRNIHIDGNEFNFIGVPSELAFALEDLPPGIDLQWDSELAKLAKKTRYASDEATKLAILLTNATIQEGSKR
ncbi:MAG: hypothetical protein AAF802_11350 [Planctomycetota bacterium]